MCGCPSHLIKIPTDPILHPFFEYHLYTLGRRTTIRDRETKQLTLLSASHIPAKKLFEYEARTYTPFNPVETESRRKVRVMLEVQNSDDWKWSLNKEDPAVKAAREKRQEEFKARYK